MRCRFLLSLVSGVLVCSQWMAQPVISAQGFGSGATGGAGKPTFYVTNNNSDTSSGSLRWALAEAAKPINGGGIISFNHPGPPAAVGGVINYSGIQGFSLEIPSNTTIAGETAVDIPGEPPGITIYGCRTRVGTNDGLTHVSNVIVRDVRFRGRVGMSNLDCFEIFNADRVLVEHCSMAWGDDGTLDIAESTNVTVEYCIIAETLDDGEHSMGMLVRGPIGGVGQITIHHNLFISNRQRSPLISNLGPTTTHGEVYNNVVYNWMEDGTHNPENHAVKANIVGNYYKDGPSTTVLNKAVYVRTGAIAYAPELGDATNGNMFVDDAGPTVFWESITSKNDYYVFVYTFFPEAAESAENNVYDFVGPSGGRDMIDQRLINEFNGAPGACIKLEPPAEEIFYLTN